MKIENQEQENMLISRVKNFVRTVKKITERLRVWASHVRDLVESQARQDVATAALRTEHAEANAMQAKALEKLRIELRAEIAELRARFKTEVSHLDNEVEWLNMSKRTVPNVIGDRPSRPA